MAVNYYYNYAIVDRESMMCVEVRTSTLDQSDASDEYEIYVTIPEYNEEYICKFYNEADGQFYYDIEYTQIFDPNA